VHNPIIQTRFLTPWMSQQHRKGFKCWWKQCWFSHV